MRPPLSYVPLLPWAILLVAVIAGLKYFGALDPRPPALSSGMATYKGVVAEVIERSGNRSIITELTDSSGNKFKARLTVNTSELHAGYSDSILIRGRLSYPTIDDSSPESFDYPSYLLNQGITAVGYVSASNIRVTYKSNSIYSKLRRTQAKCVTILKRSILSEGCADFLATALLGDESSLPDDVRRTFSNAGQAHIFALSGMHVGIVTLSIFALLFPLTLLRMRSARLLLTIMILWIYALLTGLSPSVVRAVIMASCLSLGYILQRHHSSFNSLLLAGIIILAVSPRQLFDVGFQMSFVAVGCVLAFMPFIRKSIPSYNKLLNFILSATAMSICATLGVGILVAYYFHTFPVYFIPANIPTALLLPPLMCGGILLIILESLGFNPEWLIKDIDFIYGTIYNYADLIASMPCATVKNIYLSPCIIPCYYTSLALLAVALLTKKKWAWGVLSVSVATTLILPEIMRQEIPAYEYFMPRDGRFVSIIYYDGKQAHLIAMTNSHIALEIAEKSRVKHRDFLGRRGLDSILIVAKHTSLPELNRINNAVEIHGTKYLFVNSDTLPDKAQTGTLDYVVACNGFRGNILDIADRLNPDTILLSSNLHVRRHDRYADSLALYGIPYRSLRHTAHHVAANRQR
ncbi:MAG: ComEC family competence protein [Muribaculum sp.]|nr:ComEC family competence protein [Muribaculum sp.]